MVSRAYKLRVRRRFRLQKRQVEAFGQQAERQLERNFFRRLERLRDVRRFVASWLLLLVLLAGCMVVQSRALDGYYKVLQPEPGGKVVEGIVGSFTNANPVFATGTVDQSVSRLVFSGLYSYDDRNNLIPDMADGPMDISADGRTYTIKIKPGLVWQDGMPFTVEDVLFTYQVIQNPDAQSPLNSSWQSIKVTSPAPGIVTFTLPNILASFPYSLTTGIIPKHILGKVPMSEMRTASFNTLDPIGTGPFAWQAIEVTGDSPQNRQEQIALKPFASYHAGQPKLDAFIIHTFRDRVDMITAFKDHEITAMSGVDALPEDLQNDDSVHTYSLPMTAEVMTFFRTTDGVVKDPLVRKALVQGADVPAIIAELGYPAIPAREPLLRGQVGYDAAYMQDGYIPAAANTNLNNAGWIMQSDGLRYKDGKPLTFQLYAENTSEYEKVARLLQQQWRKIGVDAQINLQKGADFQNTLSSHSYDALLYGIAIGVDPDVYAYWDSTQADVRSPNRLNFSEYSSTIADEGLESGRTRLDPALRAIKYKSFLQAWRDDNPALGLYQPRYLYVTRGPLYGLDQRFINTATDRYRNVQNWMVRQVGVPESELGAQSQ